MYEEKAWVKWGKVAYGTETLLLYEKIRLEYGTEIDYMVYEKLNFTNH
mgnify:CR=1 FL=1